MTGADKVVCQAATLLLLFTLATSPAKAQFGGFGGAGGGDMMTQMAPMLEMMKAKMGKRRFGMMMQTVGPMMSQMMEGGGGGTATTAVTGGVNFTPFVIARSRSDEANETLSFRGDANGSAQSAAR
jgi:hypothetical protein